MEHMPVRSLYLIYIAMLSVFLWKQVDCSKQEYDLKVKLKHHYDTSVLPVRNFNDAVQVYIDISLKQIVELDEREQSLLVALWMRLSWQDEYFTWSPTDYQNLSRVHMKSSDIWIPDIIPYNDIREEEKDIDKYLVAVNSTGHVQYLYPLLLKSSCKLDVTYFPFDRQKCKLIFGSWGYDGTKISLTNLKPSADLTNYLKHGEWLLLDSPTKTNVKYYSCCPEPYHDVTLTIHIERRALYFLFNLILPCIFALSVTVLGFYLPAESGEKVSLGVTVLLTLTVFLLLVAERTPPQSEVIPLISLYFGVIIVMVAISTILSVIIVHIHYKGSSGAMVPACLRKVTIQLSRILCVKANVKSIRINNENHDNDNSIKEKSVENGIEGIEQGLRLGSVYLSQKTVNQPSNPASTDKDKIHVYLKGIHAIMKKMDNRQKLKEEENLRNFEWTLVAKVFDKLFLFIFSALSIVITLSLLVRRPPD